MKVKTSELTGAALDWAVAKAKGLPEEPYVEIDGLYGAKWRGPEFSTDWSLAGRIIEREGLELCKVASDWRAVLEHEGGWLRHYGPTPLIAAMRCYVASRLGDEVDVPDELI